MAGQLRAKGVRSEDLLRIQELQPFSAENKSIWGSLKYPPLLPFVLQRLKALDNVDKHRVVHATWHSAEVVDAPWPDVPQGFVFRSGRVNRGLLDDGAEIGALLFDTPLPYEWLPDPEQMRRLFRLEVAFDDPAIVNSVRDLLSVCIWAVEQVLRLFEPVFSTGAPALPVTSSLVAESQVLSETLRVLLPIGAKAQRTWVTQIRRRP